LTGLALVLSLTAAYSTGAVAAGIPPVCHADLQQLCPNLSGVALKQCRNSNRQNFSLACKEALANTGMRLKDLKR
jgi:hypothetical protein